MRFSKWTVAKSIFRSVGYTFLFFMWHSCHRNRLLSFDFSVCSIFLKSVVYIVGILLTYTFLLHRLLHCPFKWCLLLLHFVDKTQGVRWRPGILLLQKEWFKLSQHAHRSLRRSQDWLRRIPYGINDHHASHERWPSGYSGLCASATFRQRHSLVYRVSY